MTLLWVQERPLAVVLSKKINYVGSEISARYVEYAEKRISSTYLHKPIFFKITHNTDINQIITKQQKNYGHKNFRINWKKRLYLLKKAKMS